MLLYFMLKEKVKNIMVVKGGAKMLMEASLYNRKISLPISNNINILVKYVHRDISIR